MFAASIPQSPFTRKALALVQRLALAVLGGYGLSSALVSLGAMALAGALPRSEAVVLAAMLGFPLYLVLLLWGLSSRRLGRVWLVLGLGAAVGQLLVWCYA